MNTDKYKQREQGNVMIAALFVVIVMGGLVTLINQSAVSSHRATLRNEMETKLLYIAEAGVNFEGIQIAIDSLGPVKDTLRFTLDAATDDYVGKETEFGTVDGISQPFVVRVQYLLGTTTVTFADRSNPVEAWDRIRLTSTATLGPLKRQVRAWYTMELSVDHTGAIVSDAISTGTGAGKDGAEKGNVVLADLGRGGQHHVHGCIRANGLFIYENNAGAGSGSSKASSSKGSSSKGSSSKGSSSKSSKSSKGSSSCSSAGSHDLTVNGFTACIHQNLAGTPEAIPDFTELGGDDQLFDIKKFAAIATASGTVYNGLAAFAAACNAVNKTGLKLEGMVIVEVDSALEGSDPRIDESGSIAIPDGIHITGTLIFRFSNGTDPSYRITIDTPLNINAANLTGLDPTKKSTCATGFPPVYTDTSKDPANINILPAYTNFLKSDRFPALVYTNGVIDLEDAVNISGVVYGPGLIEIQNKSGTTQYFNGELYGGGGVYVEGHKTAGYTVIKYDLNAVKDLVTQNDKARELVRTGFVILQ